MKFTIKLSIIIMLNTSMSINVQSVNKIASDEDYPNPVSRYDVL